MKFVGLGLEALKSNFARLQHPYKLNFAITYRCNSRCVTCNIWKVKPQNELTLDEIKEFAKRTNYFRWIEITGGEPFMRSDIVEIVDAFRQNSKNLYLVDMPTNSLSDESMVAKRIEGILRLGIPRVIITLSLDGYRELHDTIRGIPGNFDKVMAMARRLRELEKGYPGLSFSFGYTMSKYNQGALEKTYEAVKNELDWITYNNFHVNMGQVSDIYYNNTDAAIDAGPGRDGRRTRRVRKQKEIQHRRDADHRGRLPEEARRIHEDRKQPIRGRSLDASLFIDSYGNVYPSIMWDKKIGNIRDTGYELEPILHSKEADDVRSLIKEGKEPNCWTACEAYQSIAGHITSLL